MAAQIVELGSDGTEKGSQAMTFGKVAGKDGSLPYADMVSCIRARYQIDSATNIQLYTGFEGRQSIIDTDINTSGVLLVLDGSRTVFFARV